MAHMKARLLAPLLHTCRLWVLAKELDDMPCAAVPASTIKPPPSAASLLGHLSHLPTLERNRVGLSLLVKHACFWVEGSCDTIQGQDRGAKQQAQCSWSRAGDRGSEFASWFKPDPHLVSGWWREGKGCRCCVHRQACISMESKEAACGKDMLICMTCGSHPRIQTRCYGWLTAQHLQPTHHSWLLCHMIALAWST
jgi:hypothetical protein